MMFGRLRPDDPRTEGMRHQSREQALDLLNQVFIYFQPSNQAWIMNNAPYIAMAAACIPGLVLSHKFRTMFGVQGKGISKLITLPPAVLLPGGITYLSQRLYVRDDILLNETECAVCVDIRSAALQVSTGLALPLFFSYTGNAVSAAQYNLKIVPSTLSGWGPITRRMMNRVTPLILGFTLAQLLVAGVLVREMYKSRDLVLSEMELRFAIEAERKEALAKKS